MLTGSELLAKVKELGDVSKSDLVRNCGYVSTKNDGGDRLNFTAFYEALLEAKGLSLSNDGVGRGKGGRKLSYIATVQGNGNLLIGKAYTAMLDLKPGDEFEIKLGRKQVCLVPAGGTELDTKQEVSNDQKGRREELVEYIVDHRSQSSDWLALNLGYKTSEGKADLYKFFNDLILSLGFPERLDSSTDKLRNLIDFIHENDGGCSPIIDGDEITGRYEIRMSSEARMHDWDEEEWDEVREKTGEDYLDGPYEVQESNSYELQWEVEYDFSEACTGFQVLGGRFHDLFRQSYKNLSDDENGKKINEFLKEYEEHPYYYAELAQRLGLIV